MAEAKAEAQRVAAEAHVKVEEFVARRTKLADNQDQLRPKRRPWPMARCRRRSGRHRRREDPGARPPRATLPTSSSSAPDRESQPGDRRSTQDPEPGNWMHYRRTHDGQGYSPLRPDQHLEREKPGAGVDASRPGWSKDTRRHQSSTMA